MYTRLEELCKLMKGSNNLIIIEDWNTVVGESADGQEIGTYGLGTRNVRGDRLVDFSKQYDMVIANTYQNIHHRKRYTWKIPGDIRRHQIDYILVIKHFRNQVRRCKTHPGIDVDSDHNLLMMKNAKEARGKWLENRCKEVELLIKGNKMDPAFNTIKKFVSRKTKANIKIRDINGNLLLDNEDIVYVWKQYLEILYQGVEIISPNTENTSDMQGVTILIEEVNQVLKAMKTKIGPGVDELTSELIPNADSGRIEVVGHTVC
ncbi:Endonuclease/exonuclease/phosphatase [Cinara cedri]|uniref:Endonuclease/exonuclease/phosphatase n=1 Tax=Cinara cedri TaxID=506608 RepID=A0A5E4N033_9HEMI|nr:Endonuclease/exonuclease/phosphatase [Cinara cedri]